MASDPHPPPLFGGPTQSESMGPMEDARTSPSPPSASDLAGRPRRRRPDGGTEVAGAGSSSSGRSSRSAAKERSSAKRMQRDNGRSFPNARGAARAPAVALDAASNDGLGWPCAAHGLTAAASGWVMGAVFGAVGGLLWPPKTPEAQAAGLEVGAAAAACLGEAAGRARSSLSARLAAARAGAPRVGAQFGVLGGIYQAASCYARRLRGVEDR